MVDAIRKSVSEASLPPGSLTLEITESLLIRDPERVKKDLKRLRKTGILFSLDDFGTGYSSLQYLSQLPLDQIKIDRAFVSGIDRDKDDRMIVATIIAMARALRLTVVAEGVETSPQRDILAKNGCQIFQGYLYGRPLEETVFLDRLESSPPTTHSPLSPS